jgi:gluconate 2-dehydrogenase gamma chain
LKRLEAGGKDLAGVPGDLFFEHLWEVTLEGYFSDPVYGGNRGLISWRMIGFPGASRPTTTLLISTGSRSTGSL